MPKSAHKSPVLISAVIPPRPDVLTDIEQTVRQPNADLKKIAELIKQDVSLFSLVMTTINSARFALRQEIRSIDLALNLLGISRTLSLIQIAVLRKNFSKLGSMERFWDSAAEVAGISEQLTREWTDLDPEEAYTLGMLHDIGIPIMMLGHADYKAQLAEINGASIDQVSDFERKRYGYDHYRVGAELTRRWNLGDSIAQVIELQPDYDPILDQSADEFESQRRKLAILLMAQDISQSYRYYWRLTPDDDSLFNVRKISHFLGFSDTAYKDLKEDWVARLTDTHREES